MPQAKIVISDSGPGIEPSTSCHGDLEPGRGVLARLWRRHNFGALRSGGGGELLVRGGFLTWNYGVHVLWNASFFSVGFLFAGGLSAGGLFAGGLFAGG